MGLGVDSPFLSRWFQGCLMFHDRKWSQVTRMLKPPTKYEICLLQRVVCQRLLHKRHRGESSWRASAQAPRLGNHKHVNDREKDKWDLEIFKNSTCRQHDYHFTLYIGMIVDGENHGSSSNNTRCNWFYLTHRYHQQLDVLSAISRGEQNTLWFLGGSMWQQSAGGWTRSTTDM